MEAGKRTRLGPEGGVSPDPAPLDTSAGRRLRVAIALYADLTHDGRVQREAVTLSRAGYDVIIAALGESGVTGSDLGAHIEVESWQPVATRVLKGTWSPFRPEQAGARTSAPRGGRVGWFAGYARNLRSWGRWAVRSVGEVDIWHAVDLTGLIALGLAGIGSKPRLVYDSHELFIESGSIARMPKPARWVLVQVERRLARRASGVITVNPSIAQELSSRYGVDPVVMMNCPRLSDVRRRGRMREALGLGDRRVLLHHGSLSDGRGIPATIDALKLLPADVALVFLGNGPLVPWIREQQLRPDLAGRLYWHPAIAVDELSSWVVDADVGVMLFEPIELNFLYATPNRLFDCIAAGVPVVASDFPEFRRIVSGEGFGDVCDPANATAIADCIGGLLGDPDRLKAIGARELAAARHTYNWSTQAQAMLDLYARVASGRS